MKVMVPLIVMSAVVGELDQSRGSARCGAFEQTLLRQ
jgi:hypothetical protein